MKIGIIGSGAVARTLAAGFLRHGHQVTMGTREPGKLADWLAQNPAARVGAVAEAARFGDVVVLAVKGSAAQGVVQSLGAGALGGKVVIDTTNPIADVPPVNGVLKFFTDLNDSLMERLQAAVPAARFVKAFSCVGAPLMVNPGLKGGRPTMFICGNDAGARGTVREILDQFGWDVEDMGSAEAARAIEPLCILWCLPGFLRNEWMHALKLVR
ncbi:MAG TPA: NAD(P)-binding domain-containing protein [Candidatus Krumholzibacteria bacterium]|nr:NAD(P)-binding domain-containing protein [Candidatus Krumholzibacteria bacterium]